jgi:hypothetical protein
MLYFVRSHSLVLCRQEIITLVNEFVLVVNYNEAPPLNKNRFLQMVADIDGSVGISLTSQRLHVQMAFKFT